MGDYNKDCVANVVSIFFNIYLFIYLGAAKYHKTENRYYRKINQ